MTTISFLKRKRGRSLILNKMPIQHVSNHTLIANNTAKLFKISMFNSLICSCLHRFPRILIASQPNPDAQILDSVFRIVDNLQAIKEPVQKLLIICSNWLTTSFMIDKNFFGFVDFVDCTIAGWNFRRFRSTSCIVVADKMTTLDSVPALNIP